MFKRIGLFLLVNLLVMVTIGVVLRVLGVGTRLGSHYSSLLIFCFFWGMGGAFISLALSRFMAKMFMGVQVIDPHTSDPALANLVQTVHDLARKADIPLPEVGIYQSDDVNAFATGPTRSRSLVAVSTGLMNRMGSREVEGVLGHEITHIANGDMVTMTLLQGVINAFVLFFARIAAFALTQSMRSQDDERRGSPFLQYILVSVFEVLFSFLGMFVVAAFSRWREFRADAGGARLAGKYEMIGALRALQRLHGEPDSTDSSAFQAFKISGKKGGFLSLLATHPPLEERIGRLESSHQI